MNSASQVSSKPERRMPPRTSRVAGRQVVSSDISLVIASRLSEASPDTGRLLVGQGQMRVPAR
jgi:hypothetical protein